MIISINFINWSSCIFPSHYWVNMCSLLGWYSRACRWLGSVSCTEDLRYKRVNQEFISLNMTRGGFLSTFTVIPIGTSLYDTHGMHILQQRITHCNTEQFISLLNLLKFLFNSVITLVVLNGRHQRYEKKVSFDSKKYVQFKEIRKRVLFSIPWGYFFPYRETQEPNNSWLWLQQMNHDSKW